MATWTEDEFVSRAKTLARAHAGAKTPINDLVEKVAREAELTPDAIRTLGRLTNVAVFQELFQQKAAAAEGDRMVEFEPGDPEVVITRVVKSAAIQDAAAAVTKTASEEIPDLMSGVRGYCTELEKVASDEVLVERTAPRELEVMRLRKIAEELAVTVKTASMRWESGVARLSTAFKKAPGYGPSYADFEKAALAEHGLNARPELMSVREDLRLPAFQVSSEKIGHLADRVVYETTPQLTLLADTIKQREQYEILKSAQEQVTARLKAL